LALSGKQNSTTTTTTEIKYMKIQNPLCIALTIIMSMFAVTLAIADCDNITSGSNCSSKNSQNASCENDCTSVTYSPSGPSQTCSPIGEAFYSCGYTPCSTASVEVFENDTISENCDSNGNCLNCNATPINLPPIDQGYKCEQDYINLVTATQCGPCGVN
jgi:hypothetical protein